MRVLTDPVFGDRASPVSFAGAKRFHPVPATIAQLPRLDAVLLSHDHYDHLDRDTIRTLTDKADHFLAPLGVGDRLVAWGVDPATTMLDTKVDAGRWLDGAPTAPGSPQPAILE